MKKWGEEEVEPLGGGGEGGGGGEETTPGERRAGGEPCVDLHGAAHTAKGLILLRGELFP